MKTKGPYSREGISQPDPTLSTIVTMRVSRGLYEVLREAAEHQSLGLSAFVRVAAKSHAVKVLREKRRAA